MSDSTIRLRGITWNHTRGHLPMVATAQRFSELHRGVEIVWEKRSLQEFADYPIQKLADQFDLLVIDHPFVGYAAAHRLLLPLDEYLDGKFLADQAGHSVGRSHESYNLGEHQWALAIDAAAPVSAYRRDLFEKEKISLPETWSELLELAHRGLVAMPAIPVDSLMNFFMLCCALGEEPFAVPGRVVREEVGVGALERLRELVSLCAPQCLERNPIATYEAMISGDRAAYCPFGFGYSNYARTEYTSAVLCFGGLVKMNGGQRLRSTLGGTGLAISRRCHHVETAVEYGKFVASPESQRGLYFASGGQPGHRTAWLDSRVNEVCNNFFAATLETLDEAYLRPRHNGYLHFQDGGGLVVHRYLCEGGDPRKAMDELESLLRPQLEQ